MKNCKCEYVDHYDGIQCKECKKYIDANDINKLKKREYKLRLERLMYKTQARYSMLHRRLDRGLCSTNEFIKDAKRCSYIMNCCLVKLKEINNEQ